MDNSAGIAIMITRISRTVAAPGVTPAFQPIIVRPTPLSVTVRRVPVSSKGKAAQQGSGHQNALTLAASLILECV